jgi:hypothetical protein
MAWFDGTNGYEVNSACDQEQDHLTGQDGTSYVVQKFYSSLPIPSCVSKYTRAQDFSISAASNVLTVARGQSGSSSLSLADTSGTIAPVALLIRRLPAGVTATFSPTKPLDNAGSVLTFNVSPAAARGTFEVVVSGKMGAAVHTLGLALTID